MHNSAADQIPLMQASSALTESLIDDPFHRAIAADVRTGKCETSLRGAIIACA